MIVIAKKRMMMTIGTKVSSLCCCKCVVPVYLCSELDPRLVDATNEMSFLISLFFFLSIELVQRRE